MMVIANPDMTKLRRFGLVCPQISSIMTQNLFSKRV